jgi:hypothetical protein
MISHLLLFVVLIYLAKRIIELVILVLQRVSRQLNPDSDKPSGGGAGSSTSFDKAPGKQAPLLPGVYAVNHDQRRGSHRSALMIAAAPEVLPEVLVDLVEKLGEQIVLILGERLPGEKSDRRIISFTPLLDARQVQTLLAEYADVINRLNAIEVTAQNMEKCCYLTLNLDKSIVLEACNAAPYITALQRRGFREVQTDKFDANRHHGARLKESEVPEDRLAQFKQRLEISSSYLSGQRWVN